MDDGGFDGGDFGGGGWGDDSGGGGFFNGDGYNTNDYTDGGFYQNTDDFISNNTGTTIINENNTTIINENDGYGSDDGFQHFGHHHHNMLGHPHMGMGTVLGAAGLAGVAGYALGNRPKPNHQAGQPAMMYAPPPQQQQHYNQAAGYTSMPYPINYQQNGGNASGYAMSNMPTPQSTDYPPASGVQPPRKKPSLGRRLFGCFGFGHK